MSNELKIYEGEKLSFQLPSGKMATIREHTAMDDDILTAGLAKHGSNVMVKNFNNYVTAILTELDGKTKVTVSDVENLPLSDKYYLILKSRIHSLGDEVMIKLTCPNEECRAESEYTIDLNEYDQDLANPLQEYREADELRVRPIDIGEGYFEIELPSKRKVRLEYLTGKGENYVLAQSKTGNLKASAEILSRFPKVEVGGEWLEVKSLNVFSKKDSIVIKNAISAKDPQFSLSTEVKCEECGEIHTLPLILTKDFFFPEEI